MRLSSVAPLLLSQEARRKCSRETTHGSRRHQRAPALLREAFDGSKGSSGHAPDSAHRHLAGSAQASPVIPIRATTAPRSGLFSAHPPGSFFPAAASGTSRSAAARRWPSSRGFAKGAKPAEEREGRWPAGEEPDANSTGGRSRIDSRRYVVGSHRPTSTAEMRRWQRCLEQMARRQSV